MPASLSATGLQVQTLEEILAELKAAFLAPGAFPGHDLESATSPLAVLVGLQARREAVYQALLASVLDALYRDGAQGRVLDRIATITGEEPRRGPSQSTIQARLTGTPGTDLANKLVRYVPNGSQWRVQGADATVGGGGTVDVELRAEDDGAVEAEENNSTDWEIVTTTAGWTAVASLADLQVGELEEDDPAFRSRLVASESSGRGTEQAIHSALLRVAGVTAVTVDNNRTLVTNGNGVPAKSIEALVVGGDDDEVADALFEVICADTGTYGNTTVVVERPDGRDQDVSFSRVEELQCYAEVVLTSTGAEEDLPTDYADQVRAAVASRAESLEPGQDLHAAWFVGAIVDALPANAVVNVAITFADQPGGPYASTLAITNRQTALLADDPTPGVVFGTVAGPFAITNLWHLDVAVDGGATQVVTFPAMAGATAQEVVDEIAAVLTGATASALLSRVRIASDTTGAASEIEIVGTSTAALLAVLGLAVGAYAGADASVTSVTTV